MPTEREHTRKRSEMIPCRWRVALLDFFRRSNKTETTAAHAAETRSLAVPSPDLLALFGLTPTSASGVSVTPANAITLHRVQVHDVGRNRLCIAPAQHEVGVSRFAQSCHTIHEVGRVASNLLQGADQNMLVLKPVDAVFEAIVNPAITTKFWFSTGSSIAANLSSGNGKATPPRRTSIRNRSSLFCSKLARPGK